MLRLISYSNTLIIVHICMASDKGLKVSKTKVGVLMHNKGAAHKIGKIGVLSSIKRL